MSHTLGNYGRIASEEVDTYSLGCTVECTCKFYIVVGCLAGIATHKSYRSDGDALVYDRNSKLLGNLLARTDKVLGETCYLVVDVLAERRKTVAHTIHETDAHGDGAHVEVLLLYHLVGFDNLIDIYHDVIFCV